MERALLMAGAHCQGGHSEAGMVIAENFGIPFPLTMDNLCAAAEARGYSAAEIWPWWAPLSGRTERPITDGDAVPGTTPKEAS